MTSLVEKLKRKPFGMTFIEVLPLPHKLCALSFCLLMAQFLWPPSCLWHKVNVEVVENLLRGNSSIKETKRLVNKSSVHKVLKMRTIYKILKQIKNDKNTNSWRKFNCKKIICTYALIAAVTADIKADSQVGIQSCLSPWHISRHPFFHSTQGSLAFKEECQMGA